MTSFEPTDKPSISSVTSLDLTHWSIKNKCNLICLDETATEWVQNDTTQCRERTMMYKVPYDSSFFGKTTISSRELQVRSDPSVQIEYRRISLGHYSRNARFLLHRWHRCFQWRRKIQWYILFNDTFLSDTNIKHSSSFTCDCTSLLSQVGQHVHKTFVRVLCRCSLISSMSRTNRTQRLHRFAKRFERFE